MIARVTRILRVPCELECSGLLEGKALGEFTDPSKESPPEPADEIGEVVGVGVSVPESAAGDIDRAGDVRDVDAAGDVRDGDSVAGSGIGDVDVNADVGDEVSVADTGEGDSEVDSNRSNGC